MNYGINSIGIFCDYEYVIVSVIHHNRKEVKNWCEEFFSDSEVYVGMFGIYFKKETDAQLFILRFG